MTNLCDLYDFSMHENVLLFYVHPSLKFKVTCGFHFVHCILKMSHWVPFDKQSKNKTLFVT